MSCLCFISCLHLCGIYLWLYYRGKDHGRHVLQWVVDTVLTRWRLYLRARPGTVTRPILVGVIGRDFSRRCWTDSRCFSQRVSFCALTGIIGYDTQFQLVTVWGGLWVSRSKCQACAEWLINGVDLQHFWRMQGCTWAIFSRQKISNYRASTWVAFNMARQLSVGPLKGVPLFVASQLKMQQHLLLSHCLYFVQK